MQRPGQCPECGGLVFEDNQGGWFCGDCAWNVTREQREAVPVPQASSSVSVLEAARSTIAMLATEIEKLQPKAAFADAITGDEKTTYSMSDAAKLLGKVTGMGRNTLMLWLRNIGFLLGTNNYFNQPAQWAVDRGCAEVVLKIIPNGSKVVVTRVTGKGLRWIEKRSAA